MTRDQAIEAAFRINAPGIGFAEWSKSNNIEKLPDWWFELVRKDFSSFMFRGVATVMRE